MTRADRLRAEAKAKLDEAEALSLLEELSEEQAATLASNLDDARSLQAQADEADALAAKVAATRAELSAARPAPAGIAAAGAPVPAQPKAAVDPKAGFGRFGEFLLSAMDAGRGRKFDARLAPLAAAGSDEQGGYSAPYGGFAVPEGFMAELLTVSPEADMISGLVQQIPMQSPSVKIPARVDKNHATSVTGGLRVYRRAEADQVSASRMQMEQVHLEAHSLMGLAYVTEELLQDSPLSMLAIMEQGFRDEFSAELMDERINGDGVGRSLGILNSGCLVSVAKESGQTADTIVVANVLKARARCWGYDNAVWIANHNALPQIAQLTLTGTGGASLFSLGDGTGPSTLLGKPIIFTEFCPTVGDQGDLICANLTQYLEGIYQGVTGAESMHVRFVENERAFRFTMRRAGQPWWRSALTPRNGDSLSPFVAIAARA